MCNEEKDNIFPSVDELIGLAETNTDAGWERIDGVVCAANEQDVSEKYFAWALSVAGLKNENQNVRDLAATILNVSRGLMSQKGIRDVLAIMESDPYDIVQFRLAIALHKRGVTDPRVTAKIAAARISDNPAIQEALRMYAPEDSEDTALNVPVNH